MKSHEQHLIKYVIDFFESWIIGLHNILLNENDLCSIDFYNDTSEFWIIRILQLSLKFAADSSVQFLSKTLLIDLNLLWILFNPTLKRLFLTNDNLVFLLSDNVTLVIFAIWLHGTLLLALHKLIAVWNSEKILGVALTNFLCSWIYERQQNDICKKKFSQCLKRFLQFDKKLLNLYILS